jgi:hypothetical protein
VVLAVSAATIATNRDQFEDLKQGSVVQMLPFTISGEDGYRPDYLQVRTV